MKIAFIISSLNSPSNGMGGHYFSLLETAKKLKENNEIIIYNIGNTPALALENVQFKVVPIIYKQIAFYKIYKDLLFAIKEYKPDVIHSFDFVSFFWGRLVSYKLNIKSCLTKCGGRNQIYSPYCDNFILFSKENFNFYSNKRKFKPSNLHLIPNRISPFADDKLRIDKLLSKLQSKHLDAFKFLRISRIGSYYLKSAQQIINLVIDQNKLGINTIFIYVGTVEDEIIFKQLKFQNNYDFIYFFTEDVFTSNSKELINLSDAVLGTGRSYMEASSKSKVMLAYNPMGKYPILIQKSNFEYTFNFNFSERIQMPLLKDDITVFNNIIVDKDYRNELETLSYNMFIKYFDSTNLGSMHINIYSNIKFKNKLNLFDFILNGLFVLKTYLKL